MGRVEQVIFSLRDRLAQLREVGEGIEVEVLLLRVHLGCLERRLLVETPQVHVAGRTKDCFADWRAVHYLAGEHSTDNGVEFN